jgi:hypothetical protein
MNLLLIVSRIHDRLPHLTDYPAVYVSDNSSGNYAYGRGCTRETVWYQSREHNIDRYEDHVEATCVDGSSRY